MYLETADYRTRVQNYFIDQMLVGSEGTIKRELTLVKFGYFQDLSDIADSLSSQLETVAALNSGLGGGPLGAGLGSHGGRSGKTTSSNEDQEFPFRRQGYRRLSCSTDKVGCKTISKLITEYQSVNGRIYSSFISGLGTTLVNILSSWIRLCDLPSDRKQFSPCVIS